VAWSRTLGTQFTVQATDNERGVATINGVLLGVQEQFDALVSELCPVHHPEHAMNDSNLEARIADRLPEKPSPSGSALSPDPTRIENIKEDDEVVDRLVFSPGCLNSYRRRFAEKASPVRAEQRLRAELHGAKKYRRNREEYLRLRVRGKFEVVLKKRPVPGDLDSSYVHELKFLGPKRRRSRRPSGRRAA
jgi:hypothetical protein